MYIGEGVPQWQEGEPRGIDLTQWRVPDLVGEISDTTLAADLDEKKKLYADLEIPEYWVIDVLGKRAIAFRLQPDGKYQQCVYSEALKGLPIPLLDQTIERLSEGTNISAGSWFAQQIPHLNVERERCQYVIAFWTVPDVILCHCRSSIFMCFTFLIFCQFI